MGKIETFQQFLATQSLQVTVWGFVLNLILTSFLAIILSRIYIKYGTALSNRRLFASNFVIIAMTTMLIITIVKSSLALSLGLVGALSIVRFRAAIKEPEELAYLFLTIAIGLGFGADQRAITLVAFSIICAIIMLRSHNIKISENQNLHLTISVDNPKKINLTKIAEILKQYCSAVDIKRFDETDKILEVSFLVEFDKFERLNLAKNKLQELDSSIKITFLDNKGIY